MTSKFALLTTVLCFAYAGTGLAADTSGSKGMTKDEYKAEKDHIKADAKAARDKCKGMSGNAKSVCTAEAKGNTKTAEAKQERHEAAKGTAK